MRICGAWRGRFRFGASPLEYFGGSREAGGRQPNEKLSEPDRLGGGRGRVNPPPRRLVWRF